MSTSSRYHGFEIAGCRYARTEYRPPSEELRPHNDNLLAPATQHLAAANLGTRKSQLLNFPAFPLHTVQSSPSHPKVRLGDVPAAPPPGSRWQ
jgi:hypothetical protein